MAKTPRSLLYEGVSIDIAFREPRPTFGDLYCICGEAHPRFRPTGAVDLASLAPLQFSQVDDYFGVRSLADEGDDVVVWLYPLVDGRPVHHHAGPFDGVQLTFNVLRNPPRFASHFLECVSGFAQFAARVRYNNRKTELGIPTDLATVRADIDAVVRHWAAKGVEVGSDEALEIDC